MNNQKTIRILIAEDDFLVGRSTAALLERVGYAVVGQALNGQEAVEMTQSLRPDVILMDIKMPVMDGIEAAQHIHETCPTPVVALTAYATPEMIEQAIAAGVGAYLTKPANLPEMERAINVTIARFDDMIELRRLNTELQAEITERRRAEDALRESEEKHRTILENIEDSYFEVDIAGNFTFFNDSLCRLLGYSKDELVGMNNRGYMDDENARKVYRTFNTVYRTGKPARAFDWEVIRKDGSKRFVEASVSLIRDSTGEPVGFRGIVRDVTERKRAEEEIRQRNRELAALNTIATTMIQSALDLDEVLQLTADGIVEGLGCNTGLIFLLDEEEEFFRGGAVSTKSKILTKMNSIIGFPLLQIKIPARSDFNETVNNLLAGRATIKPEFYELVKPFWSRRVCSAMQRLLDSRSFFAIPLLSKGKTIGGIVASTAEELSEEDAEKLMTFANQAAVAIENAQLYQETQQRALEQETLREAALALTTALDRNMVIERILAQLQRVVPYDSASVQLFRGNHMELVGGRGFPNLPDLLGITFPAHADNPNSEVIRTRASVIVDDAPAVYEAFKEGPHRQISIRSWLGVPMLVSKQLVGMIALDKSEPGFYTQQHARLAEAFAAQAAVSIENARLFEETQQRVAELDTLRRTSLQLTSSLDLPAVLDSIAKNALSLVGATNCHLYLYDETSETLTFGAALWENGRRDAAVKTPRRDGLTAIVAQEGQALVINDATRHHLYATPEARKWGVHAIASFPLKRGGRVVGVFSIAFLTPHTFNKEELRVLGLLADQAAIAIENARLFSEAEQRATELSTMLEAARAVSSTLDLEQVLVLIAEEMVKATGVAGCTLSRWDREADAIVTFTEWRQRRLEDTDEPGTSYALDDFPATRAVLEKRQPISIRATDPDAGPAEMALLQKNDSLSLLMLPLVVGERVIGLVELDETEHEREFTDAEIHLCQALADQVAMAIENARLFEEEKRRSTQLALINEVGEKAASTILDSHRLMQEVTRSIQESFNYYNVALFLLDEECREVVVQAIAGGFEHVAPAEYRQSIDQGIAGFVARTGKSRLANEVSQDPYYIKGLSSEGVLIESELCVPIKLGDKVIGVLDMQSAHLNDFEQADVVVMEAVADRMAVALENARLFEETRRRAIQLQTIEEVGRRVSAILDPDELFPYVTQAIQQNFGYYHVDILLLEPATGYAIFKASSNPALDKTWKEQCLRFKIGEEGMVGWVAQSGEPLLANDVSQEPRYLSDELLPETKSELVVPLKVGERAVGLLDVYSNKLNAFDEEDLFVLQTLSNQIAIAIENARLFEEQKRRSTQLALINEVGEKATSILDSDRIMQEVTHSIQESFNYYNVALFLLDEERREAVVQAVAGGFEHVIAGDYHQSLDEGIIGLVVRTGESYLANDISKDPYYVEGFFEEALNQSELCVPVKLGDKVIGVLQVASIHLNAFDQADIVAMEAVADRLAMGIQNARLYEEMAGLYDVGLAVTSALELDKTLRTIYEQVNRLMSPDTFYIALYDEARGELRFDIFVEEGEWLPKFTKKLDEGGLTTWIVQSRKPLFIGDFEKESPPVTPGQVGKPETQSWLGFPLLVRDKVVGVISVQSFRSHAFAEGNKRTLSAFATQAAIAIENAHLFEEIEKRQVYLERVLGAAPDAMVTLDAYHRIVEWNSGAERLFGYSREEVVGQDIDNLITSPNVFEEAIGFTQAAMGGRAVPPTQAVRYRKDGSPVDVIVAGSPILVGDELIGTVAVYTDITARVRMEETLRALALVDDLTNLYNRRGFLTLAQQQLKTAIRAKRKMVLLFADFDGLKQINDAFGHAEGDRALIEVANALRETFRESDIVARIGGDEFVVLAIETDGFPAEILATRLQGNLEARNARGDHRYKLSLSVGLARYDPERPCSIDDLLAQADRTMYEEKQGNNIP